VQKSVSSKIKSSIDVYLKRKSLNKFYELFRLAGHYEMHHFMLKVSYLTALDYASSRITAHYNRFNKI
jgi:hypothetical protein